MAYRTSAGPVAALPQRVFCHPPSPAVDSVDKNTVRTCVNPHYLASSLFILVECSALSDIDLKLFYCRGRASWNMQNHSKSTE